MRAPWRRARAPPRRLRRPTPSQRTEEDAITAQAPELERLGETREWGQLLFRLLELQGWTVTVRELFGDTGVLVLAERDRIVVYRKGNSVAEVASELFLDATTRHLRRSSVDSSRALAEPRE